MARELDDLADQRGLSHRAVSANAGLGPAAVGRIVRGEVYPDVSTLARLEASLCADLLPSDRHRTLLSQGDDRQL
ncbi:helix-turn-helix domain-containing protein [Kitasatospora sp. NPDC089509]|uniref:helix-turn-helix domain-containing protein n=1 Tax=Kitasatospora sp. NPDC089509 TaxID=3364079 RepID=UPI00382CBE19